jgi:8-oxo-dGTP pyrophosphatase MutT (NUDIX family)
MAKYPDWMYRQSAVLPYRIRDGDLEVLLVTSRKGTRWVLPKGVVEPELTPPESAAKEALEEAGIEGEVSEQELGNYSYKKWGGVCKVQVFLMKVTTELDTWPEGDRRHREWLTIGAAAKRVTERRLRDLIRRVPQAIKG